MSTDPRQSSASDAVVTTPHRSPAAPISTANPREIAVVHGRDAEVNSAVFEFLRALDLHPREWEELLTRATAATPYTGHLIDKLFEDVQAVVVIFTPDDEARLHPDLHRSSEPGYETRFMCQARPNVLFEAGMAFGLYAHRTILVEVGDLRPISDLVGRHTVRLGTDTAIKSFANRLQAAGCAVNTNGTDWLTLSRFSKLAALSRRPVARLEVLDQPPRLFPTNIWLNAWTVGTREEVVAIAQREQQANPVMARTLQRDLSRSLEHWSLYSKKDGPNALLRLKGQVNLQASGPSDLRMILVQQRFALDGRPIANPPDAGPIGFAMIPGQESNVNFEVSVPDRAFREGDLLYGLRVVYEDEGKTRHNLEVFWWYDFAEDKFWNNLNKVPYFDSVRAHFW
jgi:predicted nucleotide-binding protein